jgi:hypothetical protein
MIYLAQFELWMGRSALTAVAKHSQKVFVGSRWLFPAGWSAIIGFSLSRLSVQSRGDRGEERTKQWTRQTTYEHIKQKQNRKRLTNESSLFISTFRLAQ